MKRGEQAARIRTAIQQHPALQSHEIATMLGCEVQAVHVVRSRMRKDAPAPAPVITPVVLQPRAFVKVARLVRKPPKPTRALARAFGDAGLRKDFERLCYRAGTVQAQEWLDELREGNA